MTKRILAIVMAMVMCLSVLAVEVFASNITAMNDVKATYSGTSITVSWGAVSGATKYDVEVLKSGTRVNSSTVTGTSTTLSVYNAGTFDINVYAKDSNGKAVGTGSTTCTIPQQSTQSGITVSSTSSGVKVSWNATEGVSSYYVAYTYYDANNRSQSSYTTTSSTSVDLNVAYDKLSSVSVRVGNSSGFTVGSWSNTGYNPNPGGNYGNASVTSYSSSSTLVSWGAVSGAYTYFISYGYDNGRTGTTTSYSSSVVLPVALSRLNGLSVYIGSTASGTPIATWTAGSGTGTGTNYGSVYLNNGVLSWNSNYNETYTVTFIVSNVAQTQNVVSGTTAKSYNVQSILEYYKGYTVVFSVTGSTSGSLGSASGSYYGGSNGSYGSVWVSGTTVSWQSSTNANYYITVKTANGYTLLNRRSVYGNSVDLSRISEVYSYLNNNLTIEVYNYYGTYVGSATYYAYGGVGSGTTVNSGFKVEVNGSDAVVSWNNISGVSEYTVSYTLNGRQYSMRTAQTLVTLSYTGGLTVTIKYGNVTIGTANVSSSGVVSYTGTLNNTNTPTGNYVNGMNCTLSVDANSSVLTWSPQSNAVRYEIHYKNDLNGTVRAFTSYTTTANVPLGYNTSNSFTCEIVAYSASGLIGSGPFAKVSYTGSTGVVGGSSNTSTIKNLTLTEKTTNSTTVSWNALNGATRYYVLSNNGVSYDEQYPTASVTSCVIPYGKRTAFEVYVYAYTDNSLSNRKLVGYAAHAANDSYTTTTTTKPADNEPTLSAYVTNFKGVATDKKVVLSWNAASGNPTYDVYWKRSTSSEWKLAKSTTKRALTISGLNTGVSYDFKVVANGKDSGIVTITTPKTGSTTVTAKDPSGAGTVTATVPEILSVQSKNGTLEVSWCKVKNATTYKVYIADQNSSNPSRYTAVPSTTYWPGVKIDLSGTSAKITGMKAGTYKIRIKASTDNGKTWTNLADCDYRTVTVS